MEHPAAGAPVEPNWRSPVAEVDARPGGRYRLSMEDADTGQVHTVIGEYLEVAGRAGFSTPGRGRASRSRWPAASARS